MSTGVVINPSPNAGNAVDDVIDQARRAFDLGVRQAWFSQQFSHDAISLAGLVGAAVPGLGVGTFVVPINPRHPLIISTLAQTAQAASHGNFSLGLGLGAKAIEAEAFGTTWSNPAGRLRDHLQVLRSIFDTGAVDFHGPEITSVAPDWPVSLAGGTPIPVYVAAMGPKALRVTGELADGTLPYLAGPRTLEEFIVPTITDAATAAGRPAPRVIAAVPVAVSESDEVRRLAGEELTFYESIPSYAKVLERENADRAVDLAAIGSADAVRAQLRRYLDAGATDLVLAPLRSNASDPQLLWEVAASL